MRILNGYIAIKRRIGQIRTWYMFFSKALRKNIMAMLRKYGLKNDYKDLKELHNMYNGACYIIGNGPSLQIADLEKISGKVSFATNGIMDLFSQTEWRPDFYGIQDPKVYANKKDNIDLGDYKAVFIGDNLNIEQCSDKIFVFPHNADYNAYNAYVKNIVKTKFSNDISCMVYDGFTIIYSLIQIAIYMGFDTIYLYGCDCNYSVGSDINYFSGAKDSLMINDTQVGLRMIKAYECMNRLLPTNVKIYNATRGGMLEVFPRIDFDNTLT